MLRVVMLVERGRVPTLHTLQHGREIGGRCFAASALCTSVLPLLHAAACGVPLSPLSGEVTGRRPPRACAPPLHHTTAAIRFPRLFVEHLHKERGTSTPLRVCAPACTCSGVAPYSRAHASDAGAGFCPAGPAFTACMRDKSRQYSAAHLRRHAEVAAFLHERVELLPASQHAIYRFMLQRTDRKKSQRR